MNNLLTWKQAENEMKKLHRLMIRLDLDGKPVVYYENDNFYFYYGANETKQQSRLVNEHSWVKNIKWERCN